MKQRISIALVACVGAFWCMGFAGCTKAAVETPPPQDLCLLGEESVPRISPDELKAHLDDPGWVIIDVRLPSDLAASSAKIGGSVREDFRTVPKWAPKYPKDKTIALYCA